jgi:hypothetical protein
VVSGVYAQDQPLSSITSRSKAIFVPQSILTGAKMTRSSPFLLFQIIQNQLPAPQNPSLITKKYSAITKKYSATEKKLSEIEE